MTPVWWLLAFIPLLVALYFLKLKRQEMVISSTYLWKRSLEDLHVNSPFQRLRRSLLFLLQLLILCCLIAAAWEPRVASVEAGGRNLIVLIDNSASMNARENDGTRLEIARRQALELIDKLGPGDRMALLSFASGTTMLQPLTSDQTLLESKVNSLESTSLPTDLRQALVVANSLAETLSSAEIHVVGDGCYGDLSTVPDEIKRLNLNFRGVATPLENTAIIEADARHTYGRERRLEIFGLVKNYTGEAREVTVSLSGAVDGEPVDAKTLELSPGEARSVLFDGTALDPGIVLLELDEEDAFPADNRVSLEIAAPRVCSVRAVGPHNPWLEKALRSIPFVRYERFGLAEHLANPVTEAEAAGAECSVIVFNGEAPPRLPDVPAIYIACHPPLPEGMESAKTVETPVIIDWDRTHPVNSFLVYTDIYIEKARIFEDSPHYRSLVEVEEGGLIGVLTSRREDGTRALSLVVGFDILDSDWPIFRYSFPFFFTNALRWLTSAQETGKARWRTGEPLVAIQAIRKTAADESTEVDLRFKTPSGKYLEAQVEKDGTVVLGTAEEVGVYELLETAELKRRFPVALLSESESNLAPKKSLDFGEFQVRVEEREEESARDLWWWFALAAFVVMMLEWYVYNRRVYV